MHSSLSVGDFNVVIPDQVASLGKRHCWRPMLLSDFDTAAKHFIETVLVDRVRKSTRPAVLVFVIADKIEIEVLVAVLSPLKTQAWNPRDVVARMATNL